jgi:hypothetical protein
MRHVEHIALTPYSLGTQRTLTIYRFGTAGSEPRVYVQGGMHADELAGPLTAHHLVCLLGEAAVRGAIAGDITVVPQANPIGIGQYHLAGLSGRYDAATGNNFNRGFPDVSDAVVEAVADRLRDGDTAHNREVVQGAIADALSQVTAHTEVEALRLALMRQAAGADIVLDLHTDSESELHLYIDPEQWPGAGDLAAYLEATVVMFARASGGNPFEETAAAPWLALRERHGGDSIPLPLTTVVELRGRADAYDELAAKDAAALYAFLQRRGAVAGTPPPLPEPICIAAPFEATAIVRATVAGIVAYKMPLGAMVAKGDIIAEIVDVTGDDPASTRTPVVAETSGRLFTRSLTKLARPGLPLVKIQGTEPIGTRKGYLLTD